MNANIFSCTGSLIWIQCPFLLYFAWHSAQCTAWPCHQIELDCVCILQTVQNITSNIAEVSTVSRSIVSMQKVT